MTSEDCKQLVRDWFERVWNQLDPAAIDELMSPDCEMLGLGQTVLGPEGFKAIQSQYSSAFDQIHVEPVELVGEDTIVAGTGRFSAKHKTSGLEVDFFFGYSAKCANGQVVWVRNVVDNASMLAQLHLLDESSFTSAFV